VFVLLLNVHDEDDGAEQQRKKKKKKKKKKKIASVLLCRRCYSCTDKTRGVNRVERVCVGIEIIGYFL